MLLLQEPSMVPMPMEVMVQKVKTPHVRDMGHNWGLSRGVDDDSRTVLHYLALAGDFPTMSLAVEELFDEQSVNKKNIAPRKDSKGRTALDYAELFKRPRLAEMIARQVVNAQIMSFGAWFVKHDFSLSILKMCFVLTPQLKKHLVVDDNMIDAFIALTRGMFEHEFYESVEWFFFGEWQVIRRLCRRGITIADDMNTMLMVCSSYRCVHLYNKTRHYVMETYLHHLREEVNELCADWDGVEDLEVFIRRNCNFYVNIKTSYSYVLKNADLAALPKEDGSHLFGYFVGTYCPSMVSQTRLSLLRHLVKDLQKQDSSQLLTLHQVVWGRLWYTLAEYIKILDVNLNAPLLSDERLYAWAVSMFSDNREVTDLHSLSIGELLCFVAVIDDAYSTLCWLFQQCSASKPILNGKNLVQVACTPGNLIVLKAMVSGGLGGYSGADVVTESRCGVLLALSHGHYDIAKYLLFTAKVLAGSDHEDQNGLTAIYFARRSRVTFLESYSRIASAVRALEQADALVHAGMPAAYLWKMLPEDMFTLLGSGQFFTQLSTTCLDCGRIGMCRRILEVFLAHNLNGNVDGKAKDIIKVFRECLSHLAESPQIANRAILQAYLRMYITKLKTAIPAFAARLIQALYRGRRVYCQYKHYRRRFNALLDKWAAFCPVWSQAVKFLTEIQVTKLSPTSWSEIHQRNKMIVCEDGLDMLLPDSGSSLVKAEQEVEAFDVSAQSPPLLTLVSSVVLTPATEQHVVTSIEMSGL
eukprot:gene31329-38706_t